MNTNSIDQQQQLKQSVGTDPTAPDGEASLPRDYYIRLPKDHYLHLGAPTEWWWNVGTLRSLDRTFGFEIQAASFGKIAITQVMLTDVGRQRHYQRT